MTGTCHARRQDLQQKIASMKECCSSHCKPPPKPSSCAQLMHKYGDSGIYEVYLGVDQRPVKVYCDMETDGGGWTVCIKTSGT